MKITLGQPVHSTDGPFGELADIVVDPTTNTVTHIIVEPHHRHFQARLVPTTLVDFADGVVNVKLDEGQLRSLQRVAQSEFVPIYQPIDLGEDWDVGIEHIVALPYQSYEFGLMGVGGGIGAGWGDQVTVDYDRIPKGECEIRHESHVTTSDDHQVGLVAGMIVHGDHIEGLYVETGIVGFRHLVAVPIMTVGKVRNDRITLNIDRQTFRQLTPIGEPAPDGPSKLASVEHHAATVAKRALGAVRSKFGRD